MVNSVWSKVYEFTSWFELAGHESYLYDRSVRLQAWNPNTSDSIREF